MVDPELAASFREARARYDEPVTRALAAAAARTEAAGYCEQTRIEEVVAFARRLGATRLGLAFCVGLRREATAVADILEHAGFEVASACCKLGAMPKEALGLDDAEKIRPGAHESACNPVVQARLLDRAGCQLNIVLGLCVGHDSLFFRHSEAPVTVLAAKDRVLGHNPLAAVYTSRSYYARLRED